MKRYGLMFVAWTLSMFSLFAQEMEDYEPLPMDTSLKYGVLENGLTYYVRENKTEPNRADFYIVQNVGAILEEDKENGLAHFLEHIAFNGTKNFPDKQIINYLETIGVKFGANINAYTAQDETVYNLKAVPTDRQSIVDSCLMILHDWSGCINIDSVEVEKERGVILEEWRQRNTSDRRLWKESSKQLFEGSKYAKRDVIGDTAVIKNFNYKTLREFYKRWYRPDLQAVIIVGDVNADKVVSKIKSMFKDIPARKNVPERKYEQLKKLTEPKVVILTDPEAKYTRLSINYRHNPKPDKLTASRQGYMYQVVGRLVDDMLNSRLSEIILEPNSPFAVASGEYGELVKSQDVYELNCVVSEGKCKEALVRLLTEVERAKRYGFRGTEFVRAKANMLRAFEDSYNERNKTKNNTYVREYQRNFLDFEPIPGIEWEMNEVKSLFQMFNTVEIPNIIFKERVEQPNNGITILITAPEADKDKLPTAEEIKSILSESAKYEVDRYVDAPVPTELVQNVPKIGKQKEMIKEKELKTTNWIFANGAKIILKPTTFKNDEILFYAFSNKGISSLKDISLLESAYLADDIVEANGLGTMDAIALKKALAGKSVSISSSLGLYSASLEGSCGQDDIKTLLQLIYLMQNGVRTDEKAFNALMSNYKVALQNRELDPRTALNDTISEFTYTPSPYRFSFNMDRLAKVDQYKAIEVYKQFFSNPADFTYVFVGNFTPSKIKKYVLTYIGGQKKLGRPKKFVDRKIRLREGYNSKEFKTEMSVEKMTDYFLFSCPMEHTMENSLKLSIAKSVLDYRYLESLREEKGGTYGVSVSTALSHVPVDQASMRIMFSTTEAKEAELRELITAEIDNIIATGVREQDMQKAKEALIKSRKEALRENAFWVAQIKNKETLGYSSVKKFDETVQAITSDDIAEVLTKLKANLTFISQGKK
ncbi:MAG: insulinase family protein [Paludibacteraceae bacterium]|nr:insulinase family protein [Paludibacteraceae bacterium]